MIGKLIALSVVHDGAPFPFMAPWLLQYTMTGNSRDIDVPLSDIPDPAAQYVLHQVLFINLLLYFFVVEVNFL